MKLYDFFFIIISINYKLFFFDYNFSCLVIFIGHSQQFFLSFVTFHISFILIRNHCDLHCSIRYEMKYESFSGNKIYLKFHGR